MYKILEIVLSILGTISILLQNRSEQGSSFFASGGETFKLKKGLDQFLFISTIVIIILLVFVIYLDIKSHG